MGGIDPARLMAAFSRYMREGGNQVSRTEFEENLALKMEDQRFLTDIPPLLAAGRQWNSADAAELMRQMLFPLMEGER